MFGWLKSHTVLNNDRTFNIRLTATFELQNYLSTWGSLCRRAFIRQNPPINKKAVRG